MPSSQTAVTRPPSTDSFFAEPQEIWIDEIAVDYKPIGCTK